MRDGKSHKRTRLIRELKRTLVLIYVAEIPLIPWLAYMTAKNWEVSFTEGAFVALLMIAYAFFHMWAIVEYDTMWVDDE